MRTKSKNALTASLMMAATLATAMPLSIGAVFAKGKDESAQDGRAGNWKSSAQGAPSLAACRKRVADNPSDADAQNDLGWALRQNGDRVAAEQALRESIKLNGSLPYAHSNLSVVLLDTGKTEEALSEAHKAVSLDGKQPVYRVVLGNALLSSGDTKAAIAEYQAAVIIRPDYENALYNLARALDQDGQKSEAKVALSQALALDPGDDRVMKLLDEITR